MRRRALAAAAAGLVLAFGAASAAAPARPQWFIGGIAGAGAVEKVFGVFGGELGTALNDKVAVYGEGLWMDNVVVPATYGGGGVRLVLARRQSLDIYATFSAGAAHVAVQPVFTLGGADVRIPRGRWYIDGGLRVTSIRTPDQPTNVLRVNAAMGMTF